MPRIKKTVVEAPLQTELPGIAKEVAQAQSRLKKTEALMEEQIQKVRQKYQKEIQEHQEAIREGTARMEAYALEHRDQFDKKKSRDVTHGIMGFRIGNPAVKIARGLATKIVGILETAGYTDMLRTKKELDKDYILRNRENSELMGKLNTLGISVEQSETFYFEPKEEEIVA